MICSISILYGPQLPVWEREEWQRHLIIKDIVEHVLSRHLSIPKENIVPVVDQLDFCLLHRNVGMDIIAGLLSVFAFSSLENVHFE